MSTPTGLVAFVAVVLVATAVARYGRPGPKRTHVYETEDGERANPLADVSEGAADTDCGCRDCGTELESESFRYCTSCLAGSVADD
jgi:hypothetical protein